MACTRTLAAILLIGLPVVLGTTVAFNELSNVALVSVLALPRVILTCALVQRFFRPRGGWRESAVWGLVSAAAATILDLVVLGNFEDVSWLRIPWC